MKKSLLLALPLLLLLAYACTEKTEDKKVELLNNFQPLTSGSSWTYSDYPNVNIYTQYLTGLDSTFDGKKYREMMNTQSGISWYRKSGSSYYHLYSYGNQKIELLYLKDDGVKGTGWEVTYTSNGFDNRLAYVLMAVDVPKLVYGAIYNHCIDVRLNHYVDFGEGGTLVSQEYYTYANNIGLIFVDRGDQDKTYLSNCTIR
jgi:hypothetical protein